MGTSNRDQSCYTLVIEATRDLPRDAVIETHFENPHGTSPMIARVATQPEQRTYLLQSPPIEGLQPENYYEVVIYLLSDDEGWEPITRYFEYVKF